VSLQLSTNIFLVRPAIQERKAIDSIHSPISGLVLRIINNII
jgi:hypothetical protein